MLVSVRGGSAFQKKLASSAIEFAKKELLPKIHRIAITVKLRKFHSDEGNVVGWCTYDDLTKKNHRVFTVEVCMDQPLEGFIKTILHEMVHVKQYAFAEMQQQYEEGKHRTIWKGNDHTKTAYTKSPWEKEAYRLQNKLYVKFMKHSIIT